MKRASRKSMRGGDIGYISKNAPSSEELSSTHIDKRMIPYLTHDRSQDIVIEAKYYEIVPPTGQNMASGTQAFHVDGDTESMMSLSESYFVVNATIADTASHGLQAESRNYCLAPFAPHLWAGNIKTRLSNVDLSDEHADGLYAYSAFHKRLLKKAAEPVTYVVPANLLTGTGANVDFIAPMSQEGKDASVTLESLGIPYQTTDSAIVDFNYAISTPVPFRNMNACFYKNLVTPYNNDETPIASSGTVEWVWRPEEGIWQQKNYLPTGLALDCVINIDQLTKYMMFKSNSTTADYNQPVVTLNSVALFLCRVKPREDALLSINSALNTSPFTYPINYSRTESYLLKSGLRLATQTCLQGIIPNAIIIQLVSNATFTRALTNSDCSPFSSGSLMRVEAMPQVTRLWATVGSEKFPKDSQYLTNVSSAYQQSEQNSYDEYRKMCVDYDKPYMTFKHWKNNYTLFCINCTPNSDCPFYAATDDARTGSVIVKIEFSTALASDFTMIISAHQGAEFAVDKGRNVSKNGF